MTGLMVLQQMDTVAISALPADIPATVEVDITNLDMESADHHRRPACAAGC